MSDYYDSFSSSRPSVGDTKLSIVSADHNGWILCDGRNLQVREFRSLFSVIGFTFGGSGETFRLPYPAGRVPGVAGAGAGLTVRAIGDVVGEETHVLDISEMPQHVHTGTTDPSGLHTHAITDPGHSHSYVNQPNSINIHNLTTQTDAADNINANQTTGSSTTGITINAAGSHSHTFTTNQTGGSQPHNNMQPTLFMGNMFIYNGVPKYGMSSAGGYNWF